MFSALVLTALLGQNPDPQGGAIATGQPPSEQTQQMPVYGSAQSYGYSQPATVLPPAPYSMQSYGYASQQSYGYSEQSYGSQQLYGGSCAAPTGQYQQVVVKKKIKFFGGGHKRVARRAARGCGGCG